MNWSILVLGAVLGASLMFIGALAYGSAGPATGLINADKICTERFGAEWSGEQVTVNPNNGTAMVDCTNGTAMRRIGVELEVSV